MCNSILDILALALPSEYAYMHAVQLMPFIKLAVLLSDVDVGRESVATKWNHCLYGVRFRFMDMRSIISPSPKVIWTSLPTMYCVYSRFMAGRVFPTV